MVTSEWRDLPIFVNMASRSLDGRFTTVPCTSSNASKSINRLGKIARLTKPITAHDLRRGYVQDVASLSDSRTAREAVGHTDGAVTRVYLSKGRKSDVDWASMRLVQDTDKENAMVPKRRRNDVLLPPSPERKALTQIRALNLNARETDKRTNDLETNETGIESDSDDPLNNLEVDLSQIDPLLRELGATGDEEINLEDDNAFPISDLTPYNSGSWLDFVTKMAKQESLPRAPCERLNPTTETVKNFHTFQCPNCDEIAHDRVVISEHHKIVHQEQSYVCPTCEKHFLSRRKLTSHLYSHKDARFQCEKCDKRFKRKANLEWHDAREHIQEKPFACVRCEDKKFATKGLLDEHWRLSHGNKFSCKYPLCTATFPNVQSRLSHHWTQHKMSDQPMLYCEKCSYQTPIPRDLGVRKRTKGHR